MSAEFEKIVLEKFDDLSSKTTGLSEEVHELKEKVNNLDEKVDNLDEKVNSNTNSIINLSKKIENNTTLINNLSKKVENNTTLINNLSKKVENNTTLINNLSKKVEQQGLNFAKFENDFNIKIQGLFDSFVANTESHLAYDKFISALNAKTYNQDLRISVLEDLFKNTKLLATN